MTALAADRDPGYCGERATKEVPVYAGEKIYGGALTCLRSDGYLVEAATTAGLKLAGINLGDYRNGSRTVDNSTGASGAKYATVEQRGVFKAAMSGITLADVGKSCWVVDDQTVSTTPGNVYAGEIVDYETNIALVDITPATHRRSAKHRMTFVGPAGAAGAVQSALEFTRKMQLKRWYFDVLTAPGGADTCTCTITDGTTSVVATISASAVHAEDEAVAVAPFLADTDTSVTFARSGSSAANPTIVLEFEEL